MKKHFLKILFVCMFLFSPLVVEAAFGDLRYEITDVNISGSNITFKGWAFIHKTNNFNTVVDSDGIVYYGGQKIRMRAINEDTGQEIAIVSVDGSDEVNYNFYCEMFYKGWGDADGNGSAETYYSCFDKENKYEVDDYYLNYTYNSCTGADGVYSQCYYEDMYFSITFDTSTWDISSDAKVKFQISASNACYQNKSGSAYTSWEDFNVLEAAVPKDTSTDYIEIDTGSIPDTVEFIASSGILMNVSNWNNKFKYDNKTTYGNWDVSKAGIVFSLNKNYSNYPNGRSSERSNSRCTSFLGSDCKGSYFYAINVQQGSNYGDDRVLAYPGNSNVAAARGSHVKPTGSFKMSVKNDKFCEVTEPLPSELSCNDSGVLSSTCEELTVRTTNGSAVVKIEQTGTVSSVMTPDRIFNGGGFSFGVMYQNNIKWSYADGKTKDHPIHDDINTAMNGKLKDFSSYIAGINLSEFNFGDIVITDKVVKKCFPTNENSKDYYGDSGLTVTCIFTFPSSSIWYDGNVEYSSITDANSFGINNKFYTGFDMFGRYDLTIKITGMDRISENSAKSDVDVSDPNYSPGVHWTGTWEDSIDGCEVNVYPLIYKTDGKYNFIYRPIDIKYPFPNRNAGINWYGWINSTNPNNKERLEKTYTNRPQYTAIINNSTMTAIKNYNKYHNYLDWDSIKEADETSSFIDNNDYGVVRGDGS